jgi:MFS family permease
VYAKLRETRHFDEQHSQPVLQGWNAALSDRLLLVYVSVNVLFTTYIAQVDNTMPLYFANFVLGKTLKGLSPTTISGLFAWYIFLVALCQLPAVRALNSLSRVRALMISIVFWGAGFLLVWSAGVTTHGQQILAIFALSVIAIAHVTYSPFATAFVAEIAPESLRGIYLAINAQCWGVGFFVGSFVGGLALDNQKVASHTITSGFTANNLWLAAAASTLVGFVILKTLDWMCDRQETTLI